MKKGFLFWATHASIDVEEASIFTHKITTFFRIRIKRDCYGSRKAGWEEQKQEDGLAIRENEDCGRYGSGKRGAFGSEHEYLQDLMKAFGENLWTRKSARMIWLSADTASRQ